MLSVQVVNVFILLAFIVASRFLVTQPYRGNIGIKRAFTDFLDFPSVNQGTTGYQHHRAAG
jgi:hypothetical protein